MLDGFAISCQCIIDVRDYIIVDITSSPGMVWIRLVHSSFTTVQSDVPFA